MNDTGERKIFMGGMSFVFLFLVAVGVMSIWERLGTTNSILERLANGVYVYVVK